MAKFHLLVFAIAILSVLISCSATVYTVGDSSGWDISSDLDSWPTGKNFMVGDSLQFQYASGESVNEVTQENYDGCNTTLYIKSYTDRNTTIPLKTPGDRYFVSGNKLFCLGGMKLHVHVDGNPADPPAGAPQATPGASDLPNPSFKDNNPAASSAVLIHGGLWHIFSSVGYLFSASEFFFLMSK